MNGALPAAIGGILRHILGAVATALVTYGLLDTGATEEFIGAAMFLVTLGWSAWQKIKAARALKAAIAAPAGMAEPVPLGDSQSGARLQAHPLAVAGAVLLLVLLAGCAGPANVTTTAVTDALEEAQPDASPEQVKATIQGVIRTCVDRGTPADVRGACMAMGVSGVVEEMAYRITRYDPMDAAVSIGRIQALRAVLMRFEAPDEVFLNTDLRLASLAIVDVLGDIAKDRILRDVGLAATLDVRGGLTRARLVGEQLLLAEAMAADATHAMARIRDGTWKPEEVHAAALARIAVNEARIGVVNGVTP